MVIPNYLQTQGMRFRILCRLAIQFSKTERYPSIRDAALEPSLVRVAESRRLRLRQGGAAYLPAPSRVVKRVSSARLDASRGGGSRFLHRLASPRQARCLASLRPCCGGEGRCFYPFAGAPSTSASCVLAVVRWGRFLAPTTGSRQVRSSRNFRCLLPGFSAERGATSSPSSGPRQEGIRPALSRL